MRGVAGQWAMEVMSKGDDLGLDPSTCSDFCIISNIHQHLPTVSFTLKDTTGKALDNMLVDGDKLSVAVGLPDDLYRGNFVVMGMPSLKPAGTSNYMSVQGVLDNIGWMKKVVDKSYEGNSGDVIKQLASAAGLKVEVDATDDKMVWLPTSTTLIQHARHIASRAFSSATSAMLLATTDSGLVKFKDLDKIISGGSKAKLSQLGNGDFPILNYAVDAKNIAANAAQGYGATSMGVNEDGSNFEGNKVEMTMMSAANSISSVFQDAIGPLGARINNFVPLAGNTHKNWYKALHQNPRIKASYAFDVSVLVNRRTGIELLDSVDLELLNQATGKVSKTLSGKYIVTATTKTVVEGRYLEKIVCTSQGPGGV